MGIDRKPIIINLPYGDNSKEAFEQALERRLPADEEGTDKTSPLYDGTLPLLKYVVAYPTVYVVYANKLNRYSHKSEYTAYIGETNDIIHRTAQHLTADARTRDDWSDIAETVRRKPDAYHQYVISHPYFNKSLTLDVENRLMHYLSSAESVTKLNNRRTNAQGDYYTSEWFDSIFSQIWLELHHEDPDLFPAEEIIRDSALFKASPFHRLSEEQLDAEEAILNRLVALVDAKRTESAYEREHPTPRIIFVQGAAGTGKTVLLSHLFYRIATELGMDDDASSAGDFGGEESDAKRLKSYIVVNHKEQVHVYNQIATKLGLQKKSGDVVLLPSQFINRFSETNEHGRGLTDRPRGMADIVLIDEAHLLATQGNQGYSGKNQLYDIARRARIVVAVFDPHQILQSRQQWHPEVLERLFPNGMLFAGEVSAQDGNLDDSLDVQLGAEDGLPSIDVGVSHIRLRRQFRMAASEPVIRWIDDFAAGRGIGILPIDAGEHDVQGNLLRKPYEVKVFDSPIALYDAIKRKAEMPSGGWNGVGLSRLLATYDWPYSSATKNAKDANGYWNVDLHRVSDGRWIMGIPTSDDSTPEHVFSKPWNYQIPDPNPKRIDKDLAWAEKPYTLDEVGSIFTIQGFDLNYAGVIIGPSVKYRDGRIIFDASASANYLATNKRKDLGDFSQDNLRNELNVLLKRGVHGLYLFAVDEQLQQRLRKCCDMARSEPTL
ncbi:DUF2075 domain-containing protein [Bifidobacterium sp. CP2]|uniref:DUF2075 domain-containing protein n=1 Tax=Bifidobacterium sp. CP2 TaxID=2809025 RepID=UPI001BDC368E|nr:DUF2075 domain-containing protein [Bifidobacterium sp. CP2]MBT1181843.1 DUF2075 domain-containing protein [Bifidobacterium sp. CP2]